MPKRHSAGMGRGLQMCRYRRKGAGLSWPLSLQRRDPGKRYCSLPGWQGDFSLPKQQDKADDTKNGSRCELSAVDPPACAAKRFPTCSQLRVFAPQQQTPDQLAAIPARRESESSTGMAEKTSRIQVPVLREHHESCQNAHSTSVLIRTPNANGLTKPEGTSYVRPSLTTAA